MVGPSSGKLPATVGVSATGRKPVSFVALGASTLQRKLRKQCHVGIAVLQCGNGLRCWPGTGGKAYCNRSCANAQANRDNPKRKARGTKGGTCQDCGGVCTLGCARCASCQGKRRHAQAQNRAGKRTKGEIFRTYRSWQSARSYFTKRAREVFLEANPGARCQVCGYAKHVDVCHIRGVSDFPAEATVGEINSPDNLVGLCPTHHWELDHDSLDMPLGGRGGT